MPCPHLQPCPLPNLTTLQVPCCHSLLQEALLVVSCGSTLSPTPLVASPRSEQRGGSLLSLCLADAGNS